MRKEDRLQQEADGGDISSQYILGLMYEKGEEVEKSYIKATKYYQLAARQGDLASLNALERLGGAFFFPSKNARFALGELYLGGEGVARDEKKAADYFLKAHTQYLKVETQAPDYGHAQCRLGEMNEKGYGIPQNVPTATAFYQIAIMAGEKRAKQHLIRLAESENVEKENREQAQWVLGKLYLKSKGSVGAIRYLIKAAQQGDNAALKRLIELAQGSGWLQYELGLMYELGQGVKQNYQEAVRWYQIAMKYKNKEAKPRLIGLANEQNHPEAQFVLAQLYLNEDEVDEDDVAALYSDEKEFDRDYKVGVRYLFLAAQQNHSLALNLLTKLTDEKGKNHPEAQFKIALLCNEGVIKVENMRPQEAAQELLKPIAFPPKGMNVDEVLRTQARKVLDDIRGEEYAARFSKDIFPVINEASNQSLILVVGYEGAGKSALVNALLGHKLEWHRYASCCKLLERLQVADASKPHAFMHTGLLGTNIPALFSFDQGDTMLCDLPGFLDTDFHRISDTERDRKAEHRFHLELLSGRAKAIQAVLVVVDFNSLQIYLYIERVLSELNRIIGDVCAYEQCVFVINMKGEYHRALTPKERVDMRLDALMQRHQKNSTFITILERMKKTYLLWKSFDQPDFREELLSRLKFEAPIPTSFFRPVLQGESEQTYLGYLDRYLSDIKERGLVFPEERKESRDLAGNSSNSTNAGMMLQWLSDGRADSANVKTDSADEVVVIQRSGPSS